MGQWVTAAGINWIRQVCGWHESDIILLGQSIGTGIVASIATMYETSAKQGHCAPLGGVILVSPYASLREVVKSAVYMNTCTLLSVCAGGLVPADALHTENNAKVWYNTPAFIIHGKEDKMIPPKQGEDVFKSIPNKMTHSQKSLFMVIDGVG